MGRMRSANRRAKPCLEGGPNDPISLLGPLWPKTSPVTCTGFWVKRPPFPPTTRNSRQAACTAAAVRFATRR